jgi:hypothetical protein
MVLANGRLCAEHVILGTQPSSSCWSCHLLREEFLLVPIHSPPLSSRLFGPSACHVVVVQPSILAMQEAEIYDAHNIGLRAKATWRPY